MPPDALWEIPTRQEVTDAVLTMWKLAEFYFHTGHEPQSRYWREQAALLATSAKNSGMWVEMEVGA